VNEQLQALADRFWDRAMEESPLWATILGDHRFDAEVEDLSAEAEAQSATDFQAFIDEAAAIDPDGLEKQDRITRHVLMSEAEGFVGALESRQHEYLVDVFTWTSSRASRSSGRWRTPTPGHSWRRRRRSAGSSTR
jgi:uncharacterized protein (DUF885 family)